jgi:hypothetical protein
MIEPVTTALQVKATTGNGVTTLVLPEYCRESATKFDQDVACDDLQQGESRRY